MGALPRHRLLVAVVGVGLLLRAAMVVALPHPLLTFIDANVYVRAAQDGLFLPLEGRTAGYPLFLRALHGVSASVDLPILAQHGVALVACGGLYAVARRLGLGAALAVIPAALWALPVDWLWLEHQLLTETVAMALAVAAVAAATVVPVASVRAATAIGIACALLTVAAGAARPALLVIAPGMALTLALVAPRPVWRWRAAAAGVAAYAVAATVLAVTYVAVQERQTGFRGLIAPSLKMGAYVGMAPIADCARFDVPAGTQSLCEDVPPEQRMGTDYYYFDPASPGRRLLRKSPALQPAIDEWGRRSAEAQAGDLRREHISAFGRLFGLGGRVRPGYDYGPREMRLDGADRRSAPVTVDAVGAYYGAAAARVPEPRWPYEALQVLQPWTRPPRVLLLAALLITLAGAVLGRGLTRRAALALGTVAWLPLLYATYTGGQFYTSIPSGAFLWRYTLPSMPFVGLAAATAAQSLAHRRRPPGRWCEPEVPRRSR